MTPIVGILAATCPVCAGTLRIVAQGRPTDGGYELRNILGCTVCNRQYSAVIVLSEVTVEMGTRPRHSERCDCPPCQHRWTAA